MVSVGGICPLMTLKGPSLLVIFKAYQSIYFKLL